MHVRETPQAINMHRDSLEDLPEHAVPDRYELRWFRKGDHEVWYRIQDVADQYNKITPELFGRVFGQDPAEHARRIGFIQHRWERQPVGTAAAWWDTDADGLLWGRVHWVAVKPSHQGLGLSKPLLSAVCLRLRQLGYSRALLSTSTARLKAINLYRQFGFRPSVTTASEWDSWKSLERDIALGLGPGFPDRAAL